MNPHSRSLLLQLLERWQRNRSSSRSVTLPISKREAPLYFRVTDVEEKIALHASLEDAAQEGCIILEWGKYEERHLLKRIVLMEGSRLAHFLGVVPAREMAVMLEEAVKPVISGRHPWIGDLFQQSLEKWRIGRSALGLAVEEVQDIRRLFMALEAVSDEKHRELDLRTFSARFLGDSKALERLQAKFSAAWKTRFDIDLSPDELFQSLGLTKFPWPILLKGPMIIHSTGTIIECAGVRPYLALPFCAIREVEFSKQPSYLLTIENLASFNRHAHEITDDGLVLYTNGFPSPDLQALLEQLDRRIPQEIPFFHWGDLDAGGLRIFRKMEETVRRPLRPHLMTAELLMANGKPVESLERRTLERVAASESAVRALALEMLAKDPPLALEQEQIDPQSPITIDYS